MGDSFGSEEVGKTVSALYTYLRENQFKGYEFDDFLGSRCVNAASFGSLFLRRVLVQVGENVPLNLRPFVGIPKLESTKARGFIAKGAMWLYQSTRDNYWLSEAKRHLEWLSTNRSSGYPGFSWGNHFDFASRGGFFPKGIPTVVWTAHIGEAFHIAYSLTKELKYLEALTQVGHFMKRMDRIESSDGICLAYSPGILEPIHNSNLLAAATLMRHWKETGDEEAYQLAVRAYRWSLARMNADGSFYYGEGNKYKWIDNFHTAYVIDCLVTGLELAGESVVPFETLDRAHQFWVSNFFLPDGRPKYYQNKLYPIDIQCAAQSIESLSKHLGYYPGDKEICRKVAQFTITNMRKPNGSFLYQATRWYRNKLESLHWGESTMFAALAAYERFCA